MMNFRILFYVAIGILLTVFAISLVITISENVSERASNYDKLEMAETCTELQSHYRAALKFERAFWRGGESDLITHFERSYARDLGCP